MRPEAPSPVTQRQPPTRFARWLRLLGTIHERLILLLMGILGVGTAGVLLLLYQHSTGADAVMLHRDLIVAVAIYALGLFALASVIYRLRQIRATLQREHDLLHALMDNLPDSIYFKDTGSRFLRINK